MKRLNAKVSGRVQGVGFRYFVRRAAGELDLVGYARNLPDGDVEVVAEGNAAALERLRVQLLRGPALARVTRVDDHWEATTGEFDGFTIR